MSSTSPIPWEPFDPPAVPALRQEAAERLAKHRRRRGDTAPQNSTVDHGPANPIAAAVAERYSNSVSYQEFLAREAREAREKAEAAVEIARRNAEAIAEAERALMEDLAEWNARIAAANAANPYLAAESQDSTPALLVEPPVEMPSLPQIVQSNAAPVAAVAVEQGATPSMEGPSLQESLLTEPVVVEPDTHLPGNLIEFPRQLVAARKARPRLAEGPLLETNEGTQLRIFEVEADQISTEPAATTSLPEWSSIRLDAHTESQPVAPVQAQSSFFLQPDTAPLSLRVMAALVDGCVVALALIVFVLGVAWASPELPTGKMAAGAAAGVLAVLWTGYQMLFFSLSEATPGMRYARIGLCTFADENPTRGAMRLRILATLLSAMPVGLGLLWACLDDDHLGWNDRISRMYQRSY